MNLRVGGKIRRSLSSLSPNAQPLKTTPASLASSTQISMTSAPRTQNQFRGWEGAAHLRCGSRTSARTIETMTSRRLTSCLPANCLVPTSSALVLIVPRSLG